MRVDGAVPGYLASVLAASIVFSGGIALAYLREPLRPDHMIVLSLFTLLMTVLIAVGALLPFLASRWLARRFGRPGPWFDATAGGVIGLAFGPLMAALGPGSALSGTPVPTFWQAYLACVEISGPFLFLGGLAGGSVYWLVVDRRCGARGGAV